MFNGDQSLSRIYGGTGDDTLVVTGDRFVAEFFGGKGVDTVDLRGATVSAGPGYNFELAPYPNTPEFLRFFNGVSMRAAADIERIFGSDGAVVAALHIHGPAYRFPNPEQTHDVGLLLIEAATGLAAQWAES